MPVCTQQVPTPTEKRNRKHRCPACVRERAREVTVLRVSVGVFSNSQDRVRSAPTSPPPIPFQSDRCYRSRTSEGSLVPVQPAAQERRKTGPQRQPAAQECRQREQRGRADKGIDRQGDRRHPGLPQPPKGRAATTGRPERCSIIYTQVRSMLL